MQNWAGVLSDDTWVMARRAEPQDSATQQAVSAAERSASQRVPGKSEMSHTVENAQVESPQALESADRCLQCQRSSRLSLSTQASRVVFVSEALDESSDDLLKKMIFAMGLDPSLTPLVLLSRCEASSSSPHEAHSICSQFLPRELNRLSPLIAVTLGKVATQAALMTDQPISGLRGEFQSRSSLGSVRVLPTFQPSYLIKNPAAKADTWKDLLKVCKSLGVTPAGPKGKR